MRSQMTLWIPCGLRRLGGNKSTIHQAGYRRAGTRPPFVHRPGWHDGCPCCQARRSRLRPRRRPCIGVANGDPVVPCERKWTASAPRVTMWCAPGGAVSAARADDGNSGRRRQLQGNYVGFWSTRDLLRQGEKPGRQSAGIECGGQTGGPSLMETMESVRAMYAGPIVNWHRQAPPSVQYTSTISLGQSLRSTDHRPSNVDLLRTGSNNTCCSDMPVAELERRLMMAGLNHESTRQRRRAICAIDLEVTSNRPDCLGHIGHCPRGGRAVGARAEASGRQSAAGAKLGRRT